jgi:3-oxoacyl-[acyl-carrier protein] reductase
MHSSPSLEGKVAVVTGGTRGIGLGIAAAFVEHGATVVATGRGNDHFKLAREHVDRMMSAGSAPPRGRFEPRVADVRDHKSVEAAITAAVGDFGGLDILVNNAGIGSFGEVAAQPIEQWRDVIDTNLTGVFYCCHAAIPHLRRRGGGWIINISSLASKNPFAGAAAYCASKAGLNAFTDVLMQEVRYDGIRVSAVLPGSVGTEFGGGRVGLASPRPQDGTEVKVGGTDWKLAPEDVARVVLDLVLHDPRSLPSRVEIRPSKPRK